jgi:hypothetical protein
MIAERAPGTTERLDAAVAELQGMTLSRYPEASFDVAPGTDPDGLYVTATVDVEDTDEVFDLIVGRLLDMQVDEGLPVYVLPVRPVERVVAERRERMT